MRSSFIALLAALTLSPALTAIRPDILRSVGAVPAHLAGRFRDATGFQQSASGQYFVFDRRSHVVFGIDEQQASAWEIVHIGAEPGRIIDPTAFSVEPGGTFAVADAPNNQERIQIFSPANFGIGGFLLPRHTGHEDDRELHLTLNSGFPLVDPRGGFYFVFQTGEPTLRKYDKAGTLIFERHIQGREIDDFVGALPTTWPRRQTGNGEVPLVRPTVRAAAVDPAGNLWVAFVVPHTYVFDTDGDKFRTVQFRGAGAIAPGSLFFGVKGRLLVTPGLYEFIP